MDPYKMVIAVANQKGGCAKPPRRSTSLQPLLVGIKMGLPPAKVLLIDLDPQGNCATSFGIEKKRVKKTAYDLLTNDLGEELPHGGVPHRSRRPDGVHAERVDASQRKGRPPAT